MQDIFWGGQKLFELSFMMWLVFYVKSFIQLFLGTIIEIITHIWTRKNGMKNLCKTVNDLAAKLFLAAVTYNSSSEQ